MNGATKGSAQQASAELTTDPSPPNKGKNRVQVKLTGADGKPLAGAAVSVRFFMPGMADMGMAPMTATSKLTDQGNGVYAGEIDLGSGGTWQVTVTAEQAGNILVTKHLSLTATGGM
jgi:Cu(I)/Ag(I) efflux system membrane fusion protein/cobalt-zinc-cadmium efflux system membrane fusion protein